MTIREDLTKLRKTLVKYWPITAIAAFIAWPVAVFQVWFFRGAMGRLWQYVKDIVFAL